MTTHTTTIDSPLGPLVLTADPDGALTALRFADTHAGRWRAHVPTTDVSDQAADAHRQLDEYFAGERTVFDLALRPAGGPFAQRVWTALAEVRHGEVTTYGELARQIGAPGSARAVGTANASNPLCILVPCHRVVGATGALTGYVGGLERKRVLLEFERAPVGA